MKRLFAILATLVSFCTISGAETLQKDIDFHFFDTIEASSSFQITVKRGEAYSVNLVVDTRIENFLDVRLNGNILVLGIDEKEFTRDKIKNMFNQKDSSPLVLIANVYVPEDAEIKAIKLEDSAILTSDIPFKTGENLSIEATETSAVKDLEISSGSLSIRTGKKASVAVSGKSSAVSILARNSSRVELSLQADKLDIENDSFSELKVAGAVTEIKTISSGFSKLSLKTSSTAVLRVNAKGNVQIDASEADVNDVEVELNSAECRVKPKSSLVMTLVSNAKLFFDGTPALTIKKIANSSVMLLSEAAADNK